jgi:hypothetical protein
MNLQDRAYAVGIFVVLGICCIGAYVAVSGFMNVNPRGLNLGLSGPTPTAATVVATQVDTATVVVATVPPVATDTSAAPTNTPKGFKPSPTLLSRGTPSPAFLADIPTITPVTDTGTATTAAPSATAVTAGCGSPFCPVGGRPDPNIAPTGQACPLNYLWGLVLDQNGKGIPGWIIHFRDPAGNEGDTTTKAPPDPAGRYDIPTSSGGTWFIQLRDSGGNPQSALIRVDARKNNQNSAVCSTRTDFVSQ